MVQTFLWIEDLVPLNVDSMVIKALIHNIQYTYIIIIVLLMSISFEL